MIFETPNTHLPPLKTINNSWIKRKQRKSLPWKRFGYVIQTIIKFGELLLWVSLRTINALRSYVKHSKECFIRYPNTSKLVKKKFGCALFFSTHFSVFGYLMKHFSLCLIYYFNHPRDKVILEVSEAANSRHFRVRNLNVVTTLVRVYSYLMHAQTSSPKRASGTPIT